jgi:cytochrome c biogenesis factor
MGGRINAAWAQWVRLWLLTAWMCLTLGIAIGSYWAYYELGWGKHSESWVDTPCIPVANVAGELTCQALENATMSRVTNAVR